MPPAKQRQKPKKQARPKKAAQSKVKYYDVTFTCNAYDADLYIDGDYVGDANIIQALKAGLHTVRVFTDYYNNFSTTINVSSNNSVDLPLTEKTDVTGYAEVGEPVGILGFFKSLFGMITRIVYTIKTAISGLT